MRAHKPKTVSRVIDLRVEDVPWDDVRAGDCIFAEKNRYSDILGTQLFGRSTPVILLVLSREGRMMTSVSVRFGTLSGIEKWYLSNESIRPNGWTHLIRVSDDEPAQDRCRNPHETDESSSELTRGT